jgi:hypothetical protein
LLSVPDKLALVAKSVCGTELAVEEQLFVSKSKRFCELKSELVERVQFAASDEVLISETPEARTIELDAAGATVSFVMLTVGEVVVLPAASVIRAVTAKAPSERALRSSVPEKFPLLQVAVPDALPLTNTLTVRPFSEQFPLNATALRLELALR